LYIRLRETQGSFAELFFVLKKAASRGKIDLNWYIATLKKEPE
jgi:hypothetical protein